MNQGIQTRVSSIILACLAAVIGAAAFIGYPSTAWAQERNQASPLIIAASSTAESAIPLAGEPASSAAVTYQVSADGSFSGLKSNGETAGTANAAGASNLDAVEIGLDLSGYTTGQVHYQVRASQSGWQAAVTDNVVADVPDDEWVYGIKIALSGDVSRFYDVSYRVYAAGVGWLSWKKNGSIAGATDAARAIQALEVKLVAIAGAPTADESAGIVGMRYSANVQNGSWTAMSADNEIAGKAKSGQRITDLKVALDTGVYTGSVKYRMRRATGKWTGWKSNGAELGARDNIEAIQIKLTGKISKTHDIVYRAYVKGIGWQRRMRNGESAGVEGSNRRIEAIRICLESKNARNGWVSEGGAWSFYQKGVPLAGTWLNTKESPIDAGSKGSKRYWLDTSGALAVNRFIIPSTDLDMGADYAALASESGYLACGKHVSADGVVTLSDDEGRLYTTTRWLKTDKFDGTKQRYRLKNVGAYAIVQTGLFKVAGKKYYGYEDGRGYVMKSTTRWAAGKWYKANKNGVLKNVNKKTKQHINRYVKWAKKVARNNSHGYSQQNRWGPDYDCSSLVVSALNAAGFPESGALWTGNMKKCLKKIGFVWHKGTKGLRCGDILLVHASYRQHTEIYLGKNKLVGAHSSENGGIYGKAGDQTGNEISVVKYYNAPWQGYLRYRS